MAPTSEEKDGVLCSGPTGRPTEEEPPKVSTLLHAAVLEGNMKRLNELMDANESEVNRVDVVGDTPLFTAVNKGNVAATEALLKRGAKVDVYNNEGDTVLHVAAREDRFTILPLLLEKTEDVGCANAAGEAPIHLAAIRGHMTILDQLCDAGADINQDLQQSSPLHLAITHKQIKTAIKLVEQGATLDKPDSDGNVPLHLAANMGFVDADLAKLLVKKDEDMLVRRNKEGNSPLHVAMKGGHYKSANFLIDHGSPLTLKNNDGNTPLHLAAGKGYAVSAGLITTKDKKTCNVANNEGYMPLHLATIKGGLKTVDMLLELYTEDDSLWQEFLEKEKEVPVGLMDLALDNGHQSVATALANSIFWKKFMTTSTMTDPKARSTPMLRLIGDMPEVAKDIMDQCLETNSQKHIIANFELLDDRFCNWDRDGEQQKADAMKKKLMGGGGSDDGSDGVSASRVDIHIKPFTTDVSALKRSHPMKVLSDTDNTELLDHPLVRILLRRKWGIAAPIYFSFLAYYAVFISLVCAYMTHVIPPMGTNLCEQNDTSLPEVYNESTTQFTLKVSIYIFVIIGVIVEFIQMSLMKMKHYVDIRNLCDWFTYIGPVLVISSFSDCGAMKEWQYQLGIGCVFVSCMNMIYFLRIIPFLGLYVMMVVIMLQNFLQFFTIMFLFVIAFGLCFFLLLQNQMAFSDPFFSIMKNWVMMVGEMDFTDMFHGHRESSDPDAQMHYEPLTWLLYVMFLVFLSLIIMNLLTSLAVSGIEQLQEDSKYCMMSLQIKLALNVEFAFPLWFQHRLRCVVRYQRLKLEGKGNKALGKLKKWVQSVVFGDLCIEDIVKEAQQVIQERKDEGKHKETKKVLTRKQVELAVFNKTKEMRVELKEIDKTVEGVDNRLRNVEDQLKSIHAMLVKLVAE